jgi:hypothetical protein
MAAIRFDCFPLDLGLAKHNFSSHTIKVALTNTKPDAESDTGFADITELSAGNGYTAGGLTLAGLVWALDGKVARLTADDAAFEADGGALGPFRWLVVYNDTTSGKPLLVAWDYGSERTLLDGERLAIDFDAITRVLGIAAA